MGKSKLTALDFSNLFIGPERAQIGVVCLFRFQVLLKRNVDLMMIWNKCWYKWSAHIWIAARSTVKPKGQFRWLVAVSERRITTKCKPQQFTPFLFAFYECLLRQMQLFIDMHDYLQCHRLGRNSKYCRTFSGPSFCDPNESENMTPSCVCLAVMNVVWTALPHDVYCLKRHIAFGSV